MKLYLISQSQNNDYDTFDSAVVCAENEEKAKLIHPYEYWGEAIERDRWWKSKNRYWCDSPNYVKVEFLGFAKNGTEEGIILASFNAG